jgi:glycosyltransferase involved in cell wall biosynthesis
MPAVSVIMPAFNVAPYIGEAIESVLGQTYADLKLLVVNDGSTDGRDVIADAAEARGAIESGDFAAASQHLTALHHIKGGALLRLARFMARWTPSLLSTAYNVRRARLAMSRAARQRIA